MTAASSPGRLLPWLWLLGCAALLTGCGGVGNSARAPLLRATGGLPALAGVTPEKPVVVPMRPRGAHTVPIVSARINGGETFPMVLDTGGNHTMLSDRRADRSHVVRLQGGGHITTAFGNKKPTGMGLINKLEFGPLGMRGLPVLIHEFPSQGLAEVLGPDLNVLGTPAMASFSFITFDYRSNRVIFSAKEIYRAPSRDHAVKLPLKVEPTGHLSVPLGFRGGKTIRAIVDTGYDGVLLLGKSTVDTHNLREGATGGRTVRAVGPGAHTDGEVITLPGIFLDGHFFPNVEAWTGDIGEPALLGSGLMRYFRTTFDFHRMVLWLEVTR